MVKFTKSLESATRKKIDLILNNLEWNTDEEDLNCNVFTERAKTIEQNKSFKGKFPDYVLYKSNSDEPIAIIEAKRKGSSIDDALKQGIELYAKPLGIDIVFAIDGTFVKSWSIKSNDELYIDGDILKELISEKKLLRFIIEGKNISDVTPEVKYTREELIKIFKWANNLLRKEGLRQGVERFSEFANILFFKLITEIEENKEDVGEERILPEKYCWNSFANLPADTMLEYINGTVLPYLGNKYNHSGDVFQRELQIKNPYVLKEIVDKLSELKLINTDSDIKGDAFEYFLKQSVTVGNDLGEYFTPRHIVRLMIKILNPRFGEKIYDPCCGTGGFLIEAFKHIKQNCKNSTENIKQLKEKTIFGVELTNTAKIAKMNMILTGDGHNNIRQMDVLKNIEKNKYDVVITNPPYSQDTDFGNHYPIPTTQADCIFLQNIVLSLNNKGRCAVIVPDGLLSEFKQSAYVNTRKYLLENTKVEAVISLPAGVFYPYTGAKTSILVFNKNKETDKVWYFDVKNDGFELTTKRKQIKGKNDIDMLLEYWNTKKEVNLGFFVEYNRIKNNFYKLNMSDYKEYLPKKTKNIDLNNIFKEINDLNSNISAEIKNLDKILTDINSKNIIEYKLIELSDIKTGGTPSTTKDKYWDGGDIAWIRSGELKDLKIFDSEKKITKEGLDNSNAKMFPKKTVLIALTGATTGKTGLLEIDASTNQSVTGILPSDKFVPEYLWYFLRVKYDEIKSKSYGRAQQHIRQGIVEDIIIPLPEIKTQEIIVNKIKYIEELKTKISLLNNKISVLLEESLRKNIFN